MIIVDHQKTLLQWRHEIPGDRPTDTRVLITQIKKGCLINSLRQPLVIFFVLFAFTSPVSRQK
jgi:hypothetical protein